jgi:hypothetical protein
MSITIQGVRILNSNSIIDLFTDATGDPIPSWLARDWMRRTFGTAELPPGRFEWVQGLQTVPCAPGYWLTAAGHEGGLSGVRWVGERVG